MFDKEYMEYDEFGVVTIHCMCCHKAVVERTYVPRTSLLDPAKVVNVMALKRLAYHQEVGVRLSDGSITGLPFCTDCAGKPLDLEKVQDLRMRTMTKEMIMSGKEPTYINQVMRRQRDCKLAGRLEDVKAGHRGETVPAPIKE